MALTVPATRKESGRLGHDTAMAMPRYPPPLKSSSITIDSMELIMVVVSVLNKQSERGIHSSSSSSGAQSLKGHI
jgi:hypothetical protein